MFSPTPPPEEQLCWRVTVRRGTDSPLLHLAYRKWGSKDITHGCMRFFGALYQEIQSPKLGLSRSQHPNLHHRPTLEMPSCICFPLNSRRGRVFGLDRGRRQAQSFVDNHPGPHRHFFIDIHSNIHHRWIYLVSFVSKIHVLTYTQKLFLGNHSKHIRRSSTKPPSTIAWSAYILPMSTSIRLIHKGPSVVTVVALYPFRFRHEHPLENSAFYSTHSYPHP